MTATTNDREFRHRRSLKRLGYDLVDADAGAFYVRHRAACSLTHYLRRSSIEL